MVLKTGLNQPDAESLPGTKHTGKLRERQRSCSTGKLGYTSIPVPRLKFGLLIFYEPKKVTIYLLSKT
ncbi:hypothetical protein Hanom_Chr01g00004561 [Helianthus anomalus]